jgi:hypothetical protein
MALIQTADPEKAEGTIKEAFDMMTQSIGMIPTPLNLYSASPGFFDLQWGSVKYFMGHPALSFGLLSSIRYLVAKKHDFVFCTNFNHEFLKKQGLTDEDIQKMTEDPGKAPLEDREQVLLKFVLKAIDTPDAVAQADMDELHELDWADKDILDAVIHGIGMVSSNILMKAFKMDITC